MANQRFFKRSYHLKIQDEQAGTTKDLSALDVKFHVHRMVGQHKFEADIDILGLSAESINSITATSVMSPVSARSQRKKIILSAGYENAEVAIFSGYIVSAYTDSPPQMWLHIKADNYLEDNNHTIYDISLEEDVKLFDILEYVGKQIGCVVINKSTQSNNPVGGFYYFGTQTDIVSGLSDLADWEVFVDNGFLYAVDRIGSSDGNMKVNRHTGLLATSSVTYIGADMTMFLQEPCALGQSVELESELMPSASGKYRIISLEFTGHFRGEKWYTILHGIRQR